MDFTKSKTITQSVKEDEYSAFMEVCCEILFIHENKYCLWEFLLNTPLLLTLITLDLYPYGVVNRYFNERIQINHLKILFQTMLSMFQ